MREYNQILRVYPAWCATALCHTARPFCHSDAKRGIRANREPRAPWRSVFALYAVVIASFYRGAYDGR
ncbi:MAG: hypothetical protein AMXMBFR4_00300 [Candidatus Hydrogenedentota bacterium]